MSRELGASGMLRSGQVVNCSGVTLAIAAGQSAEGAGVGEQRALLPFLTPGPLCSAFNSPARPSEGDASPFSLAAQLGPPAAWVAAGYRECPGPRERVMWSLAFLPQEATAQEGRWGTRVWGEAGSPSGVQGRAETFASCPTLHSTHCANLR